MALEMIDIHHSTIGMHTGRFGAKTVEFNRDRRPPSFQWGDARAPLLLPVVPEAPSRRWVLSLQDGGHLRRRGLF